MSAEQEVIRLRCQRAAIAEAQAVLRDNESEDLLSLPQLATIVETVDRVAKENAAARNDLTEALRLTVDYVGLSTLPAIPGWTWFDALTKHAPGIADQFVEQYAREGMQAARAGRTDHPLGGIIINTVDQLGKTIGVDDLAARLMVVGRDLAAVAPTDHDVDDDIRVAAPGQFRGCSCVKVPAMGHHPFEASTAHAELCRLCGYRASNVRHQPATNLEADQ